MLRLILVYVLCLVSSAVSMAQSLNQIEHRNIGKELDVWVSKTEEQLVPAAEAMPEDKCGFHPTDGEFKERTRANRIGC